MFDIPKVTHFINDRSWFRKYLGVSAPRDSFMAALNSLTRAMIERESIKKYIYGGLGSVRDSLCRVFKVHLIEITRVALPVSQKYYFLENTLIANKSVPSLYI
jgi:hypothetical protein